MRSLFRRRQQVQPIGPSVDVLAAADRAAILDAAAGTIDRLLETTVSAIAAGGWTFDSAVLLRSANQPLLVAIAAVPREHREGALFSALIGTLSHLIIRQRQGVDLLFPPAAPPRPAPQQDAARSEP